MRRTNFNDPRTVAASFAGIERLLLISTDKIRPRLEQHQAAIAGAVGAGVSHIVYTSVPEPVPANPALVIADDAGTNQALRESRLKWTMLRNHLYAHLPAAAAGPRTSHERIAPQCSPRAGTKTRCTTSPAPRRSGPRPGGPRK
jgi:NAD(P)H dehydrogenase (quinone)